MLAWLRELGLRLLSTLGLYNKTATLVLLGERFNLNAHLLSFLQSEREMYSHVLEAAQLRSCRNLQLVLLIDDASRRPCHEALLALLLL